MSAVPVASAAAVLPLVVRSVTPVAEQVVAIELATVSGAALPAFTAGAHIDLHLPAAGLVRQYSLCSDPRDASRYVVAVALDAASRGGSRHVHEQVRAGQVIDVGVPRNNFPLVEDAPASVLVAGGIGVTPLVAMARRLSALGRPWLLYLCARTPERAAFLKDLMALPHGRVVPVFDGVPGVASLDLARVVEGAPAGAHFYCCGPAPLMRAFGDATRGLDAARVHTEWFAAPVAAPDAADDHRDGAFEVKLHRSGRVVAVSSKESILEALERCGVPAMSSCRDGVCGTCEVKVLSGTPDHRDFVLSEAERASGKTMLPCVSRCIGSELVLDL
jgi:vanillate O-demethylase ferredoxin subunit